MFLPWFKGTHKRLATFPFAVFLTVFVSTTQSGADEIKGKLTVSLSLDKTQYMQGEEIVGTLSLANISSETLSVSYGIHTPFQTVVWRLWSLINTQLLPTGSGSPGFRMMSERLPPRGNVQWAVDLINGYYYSPQLEPGKYGLRVLYQSQNEDLGKSEGDTVSSPNVLFTIVPPNGKEKRAFEWYKAIFGYGAREVEDSIDQIVTKTKSDAYQVFLNRFPQSIYTYRIRINQANYLRGEVNHAEGTLKDVKLAKRLREITRAKYDTLLTTHLPSHREDEIRYWFAITCIELGDTTRGFNEMRKIHAMGDYVIEEWRKKMISKQK
jgi:hypothetical protein